MCLVADMLHPAVINCVNVNRKWLKILFQGHGDVFRPSANPLMFSALIGSGYQVTFVVFIVVCFAIIGDLYTEWVHKKIVFNFESSILLYDQARIKGPAGPKHMVLLAEQKNEGSIALIICLVGPFLLIFSLGWSGIFLSLHYGWSGHECDPLIYLILPNLVLPLLIFESKGVTHDHIC